MENIIKFANILDGVAPDSPKANTAESISVRVLASVSTDEDCRVSTLCEPYYQTCEEIAANAGENPVDLHPKLEKAAQIGLIMSYLKDGIMKYRRVPWIPGVLEYLVLNEDLDRELVAQFFVAYNRAADDQLVPNFPVSLGGLRTIPIKESVEAETKILPYEEVRTFIEKAEQLSVANCACRTTKRLLGEACEHTHIETCIGINDYADYNVRTNRARAITKEEAYKILEKCEHEGLVHQVFNTQGPDTTCFVCNCCGCSCTSLTSANLMNLQDANRSNFVAKVNPEKCVGCGACVETCNTNALALGSSFCGDKQTPVNNLPNPKTTDWSEEFYNKDFLKRKMVNSYGTAPCKTACPAHISVQGYIRKAHEGKFKEALKVIKRDNPFPAVCGRICPHNCENECSRAKVDEALAIDDIKKYIADKELIESERFIPEPYQHYTEKVAVIGAGPAGMTAAYYLAAEGYPVTVFEKLPAPGGMLKFGIPTFRLEKDVIDAEINVLREMGVEFRCGVNVGQDITLSQLRKDGYKAFYIAIGAQNGRKLGIAGENLGGVKSGIDFLREVNRGDIKAIYGNTVVIGGGNVAVDVARAAARLGNGSVKMFCLEKDEEMPTVPDEKDEAIAEGICINNSWGPVSIIGENGKVAGVEFRRCVSVYDKDGNFAPTYDDNDTCIVPCNNVYAAIGQAFDWGNLLEGSAAKPENNRVMTVDSITYRSVVDDIFGGGDCVTGPKFTIDAIATGKSGAISIHRYLRGRSLTLRREREYHALDKNTIDLNGYDKTPRQRPTTTDSVTATSTFRDLRSTLTDEQIMKESERCLGCGISVVDANKCIGCGLCTTKCEFDAIQLKRVSEFAPADNEADFYNKVFAYAGERVQNIIRNEHKSIDEIKSIPQMVVDVFNAKATQQANGGADNA